MSAYDDGDWARVTVAQDCVDFIEGHAVHWRIVDFHNLITTPANSTHRSLKNTNDYDRKRVTSKEPTPCPVVHNISMNIDFLYHLTKI